MRHLCVAMIAAAVLVAVSAAQADDNPLDLRGSIGLSGTLHGATFTSIQQQPAGTGVFEPFVRMQAANSTLETGYNTDAKPVPLDDLSSPWTHSLAYSNLVARNGNFVFTLDINQQGADPWLSLVQLQIYVADAPDLTGAFPFTSTNSVKKYDMDTGSSGDAQVYLNYNLNPGSGSADLLVEIPQFAAVAGKPWVYLYSQFGGLGPTEPPFQNNDGFEEWSAVVGTPTVVPLPSVVWAGLALFGGIGLNRGLRRWRAA